MMLTFASHFLAGGLLTLVLLSFVFIISISLLTYMVVRMSATRGEGTPEVSGPPTPASGGITADGEGSGNPNRPA